MKLINLIHISPSLSIHKMRPLRAYQSSDDKLIHHDFILYSLLLLPVFSFPWWWHCHICSNRNTWQVVGIVRKTGYWCVDAINTLLLLIEIFSIFYFIHFLIASWGSDIEMRCNQKRRGKYYKKNYFLTLNLWFWGWMAIITCAMFFIHSQFFFHAWPKSVKEETFFFANLSEFLQVARFFFNTC